MTYSGDTQEADMFYRDARVFVRSGCSKELFRTVSRLWYLPMCLNGYDLEMLKSKGYFVIVFAYSGDTQDADMFYRDARVFVRSGCSKELFRTVSRLWYLPMC